MSNVDKAESAEHKRLVKALIGKMEQDGYKIKCAASDGYTPCGETKGRIPDVRGTNADELNAIGEAKTSDDLDNERTEEQFKIFSNREMTSGKSKGKSVPFYIGISKGSEEELEKCLKKLELDKKPNIQRHSL